MAYSVEDTGSIDSDASLSNLNPGNDGPTCPRPASLPKQQLSIVYFIASIETVATQATDPFIVRLVQDTGITGGDERKIGYYAGVIGSAFCISEALTVFQWGRASDQYGRRPILLLGVLGISLTILCFGLSSSYWSLVLSRSLQGTFNAAIGVEKSVIAELSDSSNISDAYTYLSIAWNIGSTTGEYIGGSLSSPSSRWPSFFDRLQFFRDHPHSLPCVVVCLIGFTSFVTALIGLKETHPSIIAQSEAKRLLIRSDGPNHLTPLLGTQDNDAIGALLPMVTMDSDRYSLLDLLIPPVIQVVTLYVFQAFSYQAHTTLAPLVYATSIQHGGLGLSPPQIGMILGTFGVVYFAFQVLCMARFIRWCGVKNALVIGQISSVVSMGLYPLLTHHAQHRSGVVVWAILAFQLLCRVFYVMAYAPIQVVIARSAPSKSALGATIGLAQAVTSVARGLAPSLSSSLFAFSQQRRLLGGNLDYIILTLISLNGLRLALCLPPDPHDSGTSGEDI